jgi:hypothetical protein
MFDPTKAQFTQEELSAAADADAVYEIVAEAAEDGFTFGDLAAIPAVVPYLLSLYKYLASGTKADYAKKLSALALMLVRDNDWLDLPGDDDEE